MKKIFVVCLLFCMASSVFAQAEPPLSIGLGLEWNMNSRDNSAAGAALGFYYNLPIAAQPFAAGLTVTGSANFDNAFVLEPTALFRWYLHRVLPEFLSKGEYSGFFVQADLGVYLIFEDDNTWPLFNGGLRTGYRFPLGNFYVEPYVRGGYPFIFGVGVMGGMRLGGGR